MDAGTSFALRAGNGPPNHPYLEDPYSLNPGEARRCSQRLVDEVAVHCDILGRLAQAFGGETMAHEARVSAHLSRMEHSPYNLPRRVRQRTDDGQGIATTTSTLQEDAKEISMVKQPLAMPPLNRQRSHVLMKWKSQAQKGGHLSRTWGKQQLSFRISTQTPASRILFQVQKEGTWRASL